MQAKTFFFVNAVILGLIVWRILAGRRPLQPTPLEIKNHPDDRPVPMANVPKETATDDEPTQTQFNQRFGRGGAEQAARRVHFGEPSDQAQERSLNCWFQFNGHTWDAFEVLGVPAGSTKQACHRALVDMRRNKSQESDFLDEAWSALERYFGSES